MLLSLLAVVIVFGGLIFFHELGHFSVARALGMGVSTFSLGFGPKILKKKVGKTEYALSLVPLGGYVALVGESHDAELPDGFTKEESFSLRPAWQRLLVVLAGPVANIVLALFLCIVVALGWGVTTLLPAVGDVQQGTPAARAGLMKGDLVLSMDGVAVPSWTDLSDRISQGNGAPIVFEISRKDDTGQETVFETTITPERNERKTIFGETETAWLIGVQASGAVRYEEKGLFASAALGLRQTWNMIDVTLTGVKKLITGSVAADSVGGPILIAQMLGKQAAEGLAPLLLLTALISVNLGLLNLFPIPVLDGGSILFCIVEIIIRRPVPEKVQEWSMRVGAGLLIALMVFATFNDVMRWFR